MKDASRPLGAALALSLALSPAFPGVPQSAAAAEGGAVSIPLLTVSEMPPSDAAAAAASRAAIARSALVYGYSLDSTYGYREIGCPFTPDHILLAYESSTPGGVSRFTAVVPKRAGSAGAIQIVSVSRFGEVPYLPAAFNPHTFDIFNQVVAAEPVGRAAADGPLGNSLLLRGLCYLAMIGEPAAALSAPSLNPATIHAPAPTLAFRENGTVSQVISVRSGGGSYRVWTLTFARSGRLLKAERAEHAVDATPTLLSETTADAPIAAAPAASNTAAAEVGAAAAPARRTASAPPPEPVAAAPAAAGAPPPSGAPPPAPIAVERRTAAVKMLPQPSRRTIVNLPQPSSRFIPDASLPYPPQAPAK